MRKRKRLVEGLLRFVTLLVDELSANLMRHGYATDGFCTRQHLNADVLANV